MGPSSDLFLVFVLHSETSGRDEGTGRPSLEVRDVLCMCLDRAATGPWRHRKVLLSQPQHDLEPAGEVDNGMQGMGSFIKYPHKLNVSTRYCVCFWMSSSLGERGCLTINLPRISTSTCLSALFLPQEFVSKRVSQEPSE